MRNTAKEKKKRNKGFPYRLSNAGGTYNRKNTYVVVCKRTNEALEEYRTKVAARNSLPKWKEKMMEEVEVREK